jgi:hypothetical protein
MQQVYGLDVTSRSCRPLRLWRLIRQLPPTSRLARAEDPAALWTETDYLVANLIDQVAALTWVVGSLGGGKRQKPKPIKRPGGEMAKETHAQYHATSRDRLDQVLAAVHATP